MDAQHGAGLVLGGPVGGTGGACTGGSGSRWCGPDGGGGSGVGVLRRGALGVGVARVSVHDFAIGVERFDFELCVTVRKGVAIDVFGEGPVGGSKGCGGSGYECAEGEVVKDFAAVSAIIQYSERSLEGAEKGLSYLHTFALPYFRRHSS